MKLQIVCFAFITFIQATTLPENFKKCKKSDPDFKACLREASEFNIHQITHPFADYRLPSLTPLVIPTITIGTGKRAVAVQQNFKDCSLYGFNNIQIKQFEFDFDQKVLHINANFDKIIKKCNYEISGQILLLPITGKGKSTVVLENMNLFGHMSYTERKQKHKTYATFDARNLTFNVDHVSFDFENLFNGNQLLSDNMNKILNDNWKEIFDDVKESYVNVMNSVIQSLTNGFFSAASFQEIFAE